MRDEGCGVAGGWREIRFSRTFGGTVRPSLPMKTFDCDSCGERIFFENTGCLGCGSRRRGAAPLPLRAARRLAAAPHHRLRRRAPLGGLGRDMGPLYLHITDTLEAARHNGIEIRTSAGRHVARNPRGETFSTVAEDWLPCA